MLNKEKLMLSAGIMIILMMFNDVFLTVYPYYKQERKTDIHMVKLIYVLLVYFLKVYLKKQTDQLILS